VFTAYSYPSGPKGVFGIFKDEIDFKELGEFEKYGNRLSFIYRNRTEILAPL
jgi:hypothetical protein